MKVIITVVKIVVSFLSYEHTFLLCYIRIEYNIYFSNYINYNIIYFFLHIHSFIHLLFDPTI